MNDYTEVTNALEKAYLKAESEFKKDEGQAFLSLIPAPRLKWILAISSEAESQKAAIAVLTTSLAKKSSSPEQDVRLHQSKMKGGYSGRSLDFACVTPFIKSKFRRFAMKESGWLTRSFEQDSPYNIAYKGAIRNKAVKLAFLNILDDIENEKVKPEGYLVALFIEMIKHVRKTEALLQKKFVPQEATITWIVGSLRNHFFSEYRNSGASRLPVIAIYSIYELLLTDVARYGNKHLEPLRAHTTSDIKEHLIGDIEVKNENGAPFEGVEIKHNISISAELVKDSYEKFKETPTQRYYILTTAEPNITSGQEKAVEKEIALISEEHGCEVIVNGAMPSIKYYLRLLRDPNSFLEIYWENLQIEVKAGSDIKDEHISKWKKILETTKP